MFIWAELRGLGRDGTGQVSVSCPRLWHGDPGSVRGSPRQQGHPAPARNGCLAAQRDAHPGVKVLPELGEERQPALHKALGMLRGAPGGGHGPGPSLPPPAVPMKGSVLQRESRKLAMARAKICFKKGSLCSCAA